jgi:hypothetical protein
LMFKRVTWFGVGLVAGAALSKWVEVKARRRLARYFPTRRLTLAPSPEFAEVADRARELASGRVADIRSAVRGGRSAMASKEAELRRQFKLVDPAEEAEVRPLPAGRHMRSVGPEVERPQNW